MPLTFQVAIFIFPLRHAPGSADNMCRQKKFVAQICVRRVSAVCKLPWNKVSSSRSRRCARRSGPALFSTAIVQRSLDLGGGLISPGKKDRGHPATEAPCRWDEPQNRASLG